MTSLRNLAAQVSTDLNDFAPGHEFTTWSEDQINAYIIEGLQIAFGLRSDLFLSPVVIKLEPGSHWQKPCNCTQIQRVYGVCNEQGRVLYEIRKRKSGPSMMWTGPVCKGDPRHYRADSYAIDPVLDQIYVDPEPPAGQDVYLLVGCAQIPDAEQVKRDGVPLEAQAAVVQWALYRAKMVDSENDSSLMAAAKEHQQTFFALLQVHERALKQDPNTVASTTTEAANARQQLSV